MLGHCPGKRLAEAGRFPLREDDAFLGFERGVGIDARSDGSEKVDAFRERSYEGGSGAQPLVHAERAIDPGQHAEVRAHHLDQRFAKTSVTTPSPPSPAVGGGGKSR